LRGGLIAQMQIRRQDDSPKTSDLVTDDDMGNLQDRAEAEDYAKHSSGAASKSV